jgi:hypothetical protein
MCVCMYKFLLCKVTLPLAALSVFLSHSPFEVFHAIIGIFGVLWLQNVMLLCALRSIFYCTVLTSMTTSNHNRFKTLMMTCKTSKCVRRNKDATCERKLDCSLSVTHAIHMFRFFKVTTEKTPRSHYQYVSKPVRDVTT